ncbi:hypothetical protein [Asticcacaulis benevestitus]|uniref:Uncharacterized protein n=1 Tax=Asticcacaulis benevestitus DSM 16100 = ATCC BAA-896 TaxID=1121022 RepID=V4RMW5_9CAUL|nr:hypothetical protein [Asticcacaulis benevestitus]ESQ92578.1 hypothetical protein ABENE_08035 [Asticcacaulis benevestitus DSM 16100 = ATCC BAA-896]
MGSFDIWIFVWVVELALCSGLAFWLGGPAERTGAAIIFLGWVLSYLLQSRAGDGPGLWVIIIDVVALIAFSLLSAKSRRLWTLFAVACQFEGVVSHFAESFSDFGLFGYFTALGIWSGDALVVCVLAGVFGHQLRLRRNNRMEKGGAKLPPVRKSRLPGHRTR